MKRRKVVSGALALIVLPLTGLVSCAGWKVQPESAIIMASADEAWIIALDLLREAEFKIDSQDNSTRELRATREIVIRMVADRATPTTAEKVVHKIDLSIKARGDDKSVLEVIYRIDKVANENEAFRFFQDVRDRVARSEGGGKPSPSRR
jgi:hypothetical protein